MQMNRERKQINTINAASKLVLTIGIIGLVALGGYRLVAEINLGRHCSGYLKNAADANAIDQAEKRLAIAIKYIEDNKLTSGFTSVLWTTPSEDVGFWYENLKSSLKELQTVSSGATSLEKSNVLMKLRETILDDSGRGQKVTMPMGISVFPHNVGLAWLSGLAFVLTGIGAIGVMERHRIGGLVVIAITAFLVSILAGALST